MCEPISLLLTLASAAASAGGGIMQQQAAQRNQKNQAIADSREAAKRREIMAQTREKLKAHSAENQQNVKRTVDKVDQSGLTQQQAEQTRAQQAAEIQKTTPATAAPALGGSTPEIVQNEMAARQGRAAADVAQRGQAQAKLAGFGDMLFANDLSAQDTARRVDTVNNFARGDLEILPAEQDLAAYMTRTVPRAAGSPLGSALQGLGQLGGAVAGSGVLRPGAAPTGQFITGGMPGTLASIPKGTPMFFTGR